MSPYIGAQSQAANPYIRTHNGNKVTFLDLRPEMLKAHEMAWHLARTCRYNAMLGHWYSNAEHSILGMQFCESYLGKKQFLVHDCGEMVTGDVPSMVKALCPDYKALCDDVQGNVNLLLFSQRDFLPEVKIADQLVTAAEQKHMRGQPDEDIFCEPPARFKFHCWPWEIAMVKWMDAFTYFYPEWRH